MIKPTWGPRSAGVARMKTIKKGALYILLAFLWWACIVLIFSIEGCGWGYTATSYPGPAWAAAWGCRCDTCCLELDRIAAELAQVDIEGVSHE